MILIDGDIVAYRCAASCEPSKKKAETSGKHELAVIVEPQYLAIGRMESLLERILQECNTTNFKIFVSGSSNFRYIIFPAYKANRKDTKRPTWLEQCKEHLVTRWKAEITDGYEADDAIGIAHTETSIVASIDKDLLQLPGRHFNFVRNEHRDISSYEAERKHWELMLTGDSADGIKGIDGIGPVKASRILDGAGREGWENEVRAIYGNSSRYYLNRRLIGILRSDSEAEEVRKLNETSFSQTEGPDFPAISSEEDSSPFSTINS